ncbi:hypothetical protein OAN59_03210 [Alphaproteobacteria bacterium]|nr:hypothetical protein [Alphaproteobacteria bacterium]
MTIFEALSKFAKERKLAYKKKLFKLVALMFIVIIVAGAGAIALSEVLSFLLLVILVLSGCLFAYLKFVVLN